MWSRAGLVRSVDDHDQECLRHVAVGREVRMVLMVPRKVSPEACIERLIFAQMVSMS
jgi:hypothetical protein